MKLSIKVENKTFAVEIADTKANPMIVNVEGTEFAVYADENAAPAAAAPVAPKAAAPAPAAGAATITAPIPGTIQEVSVKEGQTVKAGDVCFILEAMKMKNNITATRAGKIATINVTKGDTVKHGQVLLSFAD